MNEEESPSIRCPSCGAPYSKTIPYGAVQLRCGYCGGTFVPNILHQAIYRCANHPDITAVGKCNDCGENFCERCLRVYDIYDTAFGSELAKLYLCPDCLKHRYANRANAAMLGGALLLAVGILTIFVFLPVAPYGSLIPVGFPAVIGGLVLFYGLWQKTSVPEENTIYKLRIQDERKRGEVLAASRDADVDDDDAYDELVQYYVNKWGAHEGFALLETEIAAHVRSGDSFSEAIRKIHFRQIGRFRAKKKKTDYEP